MSSLETSPVRHTVEVTFDLPQKSNVLLWQGRLFHQNAFLGPESEKRTTESLWLFMTFQRDKFRCTFLQTIPMQENPSCSSLSSVLKHFLSSTYQSDYMTNSIWNELATRRLDHSASDVLHIFQMLQLQRLYLSVLLTNQDMDSNTLFKLILLQKILRM